jgi:hypothetical protein
MPAGFAQANCTLTLRTGDSIQKAIDEAADGVVFCLGRGIWAEKLEIKDKALTFIGTSREETILDGHIFENSECCTDGITIKGTGQLRLEMMMIRGFPGSGIAVFESAQLALSSMEIFRNDVGLSALGSASVYIENSGFLANRASGVSSGGSTQITLQNSRIWENGSGLIAVDKTRLILQNSDVSENHLYGISASSLLINFFTPSGRAVVLVKDSKLSKNSQGIYAEFFAELTIQDSEIFENAADGVQVGNQGTASILNNKIHNNRAYGISAYSSNGLILCHGNVVENNASGNFNSADIAQKCS